MLARCAIARCAAVCRRAERDVVPLVREAECEAAVRHYLFAPKGDRVFNGSPFCSRKRTQIMFQLETSAMIDNLDAICTIPEMDYGFIGPGDLWMSMGLHTRDSMLKFGQADELKWCYSYIVETLKKNGKVAGGFTRGGDPSTIFRYIEKLDD